MTLLLASGHITHIGLTQVFSDHLSRHISPEYKGHDCNSVNKVYQVCMYIQKHSFLKPEYQLKKMQI